MAVKPIPDGYRTITPMLVADNADQLYDYVTRAFDCNILTHIKNSDGSLMAVDLRLGTSSLTICASNVEMPAYKSVLYLYVEDVDAVVKRCVSAGGTELMSPKDEPHGDRMGGVADPSGNQWWIATRIEDVAPEELQRRMQEHMAQVEQKGSAG